jgi:acyl-CoA reductase-like NAD-dependent aldehyde dehydrogenase
MTTSTQTLQQEALLPKPSEIFVDGSWIRSASNEIIETFNPSTGQRIGAAAAGSAEDVNRAVNAARRSFDEGVWTTLKPAHRQRLLWSVANMIESRAQSIAELETRNNGMRLGAALAFVHFGAEFFRYNAGWCTKLRIMTAPRTGGPDSA